MAVCLGCVRAKIHSRLNGRPFTPKVDKLSLSVNASWLVIEAERNSFFLSIQMNLSPAGVNAIDGLLETSIREVFRGNYSHPCGHCSDEDYDFMP